MNIILLTSLILIVYIDLMAIYYAVKTGMYDGIQLTFQVAFVVLIPVIGAFVVLQFALTQIKHVQPKLNKRETEPKWLGFLFLSFIFIKHGDLPIYVSSNNVHESGNSEDTSN